MTDGKKLFLKKLLNFEMRNTAHIPCTVWSANLKKNVTLSSHFSQNEIRQEGNFHYKRKLS